MKMTKADLYDWLLLHKCKIEPLGKFTTGNTVKVISPIIANTYVFLDLPIDNKPVQAFYVCNVCTKLCIPIPNHCEHMKDLVEEIQKKHNPK